MTPTSAGHQLGLPVKSLERDKHLCDEEGLPGQKRALGTRVFGATWQMPLLVPIIQSHQDSGVLALLTHLSLANKELAWRDEATEREYGEASGLQTTTHTTLLQPHWAPGLLCSPRWTRAPRSLSQHLQGRPPGSTPGALLDTRRASKTLPGPGLMGVPVCDPNGTH